MFSQMKADQKNIGNNKVRLYLRTSLLLGIYASTEVNRELTSIERSQVQSVFHTFVLCVMSDDVVFCVARVTQRNIEKIQQNFKKEAL